MFWQKDRDMMYDMFQDITAIRNKQNKYCQKEDHLKEISLPSVQSYLDEMTKCLEEMSKINEEQKTISSLLISVWKEMKPDNKKIDKKPEEKKKVPPKKKVKD